MVKMQKTYKADFDIETLRKIPQSIWILGFVSLFMDISSEMIHALLPVYLVNVLGTSTLAVGFIEGAAEAATSITKVFSGALSDWLGKRKFLTALGYGIGAFTKPIFPLATGLGWIVGARILDRIGKGIRGSPRDALIADLSPPHLRGSSFGLRQSLDTVGAFLGPVLAIILLLAFNNNFKIVFWFAAIPAFIAVLLVIFGVREPDQSTFKKTLRFPLHIKELRKFKAPFWFVVAVAEVFTLARFSEAFLILKAQSVGLSVALVPGTLIIMNIFYALASYPAGVLSDNWDRTQVLILSLMFLISSDLILAFFENVQTFVFGIILWGLHMGFSQGVLSALVADSAPLELRGTAFGLFHLLTGIAVLLSSIIAGYFWDTVGPGSTFFLGAIFASLALLGVLFYRRIF